jgi:hypothetical protein
VSNLIELLSWNVSQQLGSISSLVLIKTTKLEEYNVRLPREGEPDIVLFQFFPTAAYPTLSLYLRCFVRLAPRWGESNG